MLGLGSKAASVADRTFPGGRARVGVAARRSTPFSLPPEMLRWGKAMGVNGEVGDGGGGGAAAAREREKFDFRLVVSKGFKPSGYHPRFR